MNKAMLIAARSVCDYERTYVIYNANKKQAHKILMLHFLNQLHLKPYLRWHYKTCMQL